MVFTESNQSLQLGDSAPDFSLVNIDDKTYTLSEIKADAYLIIFMCNHCPYVKPKLQTLIDLQTKYPTVKIIGINSNESENYPEDSFENMKVIGKNFNFLYLHDPTQETAKQYGAVCTPDPFLFDSEQKLVYHGRLDGNHGKIGDGSDMDKAISYTIEKKHIDFEVNNSFGCSIKWTRL